jgi:death on curing protein
MATSAWPGQRRGVFCILNGRDLDCSVDEAELLMVSAAAGEVDVPEIARGMRAHSG